MGDSPATRLGPWLITAHNKEQAAYLVRSRAEQRGVDLTGVEVSGGEGGQWSVTVTVGERTAAADAARLAEDTQALHLGIRRRSS